MNEGLSGKGGFILAILMWAAMIIVGSNMAVPEFPYGDAGICFGSPSQWHLNPILGKLGNALLTLGVGIGLVTLNRRCNFMPTPTLAYATVFMLICGANVQGNSYLSTSTLLGSANLCAMASLMTGRGKKNASSVIFLIMTLFSWGSMCQYAFIFFIPVYACAAAAMKMFGWKELCAMVFGITAPYIIVLGFGLVDLESFRIPEINNIWMRGASNPGGTMFMIISALTALWAMLIGLRNGVLLFNANTATRSYNHVVTFAGIAVLVLMIVDFGNLHAYFMTLALVASCQIGYLYAFARKRRDWSLPVGIVMAIYITIFIIEICNPNL